MESPTRGTKEERAHTAGVGLPAAGMPPAGEEAMPGSRGALAGVGAEESYPASTTPGGTGREVKGLLSPAAPPPPAAGSKTGGEGEGARWSPGRRSIVRGPELWRLLKERLKDPNRPAFRSAWQDIELVWRVLRALVARLDLGGMGPSVVAGIIGKIL